MHLIDFINGLDKIEESRHGVIWALQDTLERIQNSNKEEITVQVTTKKKFKVISSYYNRIKLGTILELKGLNKKKLFYKQLIHLKVFISDEPFIEKNEEKIDIGYIKYFVVTARPKKYCCKVMKEQFSHHGTDNLGIKPYRASVFRDVDGIYTSGKSYNWEVKHCPFCGQNIEEHE